MFINEFFRLLTIQRCRKKVGDRKNHTRVGKVATRAGAPNTSAGKAIVTE